MAAVVGFILLFGGLVAAGVLAVMALQRPGDAVESFARAPVGCTTTLEFTETGVFYVFVELDSPFEPEGDDCEPVADGLRELDATITGSDGEIERRRDESITYDEDGYVGRSESRFTVGATGEYEIEVRGSSEGTVAAIGRDPDDGVDDLWAAAVVVGATGVLLGVMFLILAGRRSKQAAEVHVPMGPGWDLRPPEEAPNAWPPAPPTVPQVPINPYEPPAEAPPAAAAWGPPAMSAPADLPAPWAQPPRVADEPPSEASEAPHHGDDAAED